MQLEIVILNSERYIIELGVNMTKEALDEHWGRSVNYSKAFRAARSLVINFTTDKEGATISPSAFGVSKVLCFPFPFRFVF